MSTGPFTHENFIEAGNKLLEYVADYHNNIRDLPVKPALDLKPGYLKEMLPASANNEPEAFQSVLEDFTNLIMPGVVHWQSPKFHGFFPTGFSFASLLADILSAALSCQGFTWASCPAYTELEMVMMDWMAKEIGLPDKFQFRASLGGGGVIESSASEALTVAIVSAREKKISEMLKNSISGQNYQDILTKLLAFGSDQTHSSFLKAARIAGVNVHLIESEHDQRLGGHRFEHEINLAEEKGLIPFFVCATLGTTNTCAFDNLVELGEITRRHNIWLHVDAAYAGSMFVCPEFRSLLAGVEMVQSFNFNPHKLMEICFDCSLLWVENSMDFKQALGVYPTYLKSTQQDISTEYKDWQLSLGRRFRSLKLWFHVRLMGMDYIRAQIRKHVRLGQDFAALLEQDSRFKIPFPLSVGLVCFTVADNTLTNNTSQSNTKLLYQKLNEKDIFLSASEVKGIYFIRFSVGCSKCELDDVQEAWNIITSTLNELNI